MMYQIHVINTLCDLMSPNTQSFFIKFGNNKTLQLNYGSNMSKFRLRYHTRETNFIEVQYLFKNHAG